RPPSRPRLRRRTPHRLRLMPRPTPTPSCRSFEALRGGARQAARSPFFISRALPGCLANLYGAPPNFMERLQTLGRRSKLYGGPPNFTTRLQTLGRRSKLYGAPQNFT